MTASVAPYRSQSTAAIEVKDVSMTYRAHGADVHALSHVSLEIREREFISLIGPSGCGKSTLLRLVADLHQPTGGSILVQGKTPREARLGRQYGMVFQQPVLLDWRSVRKNVQLPLEIMGYDKAEQERRTERLLELVGLAKFAGKYPWQLSGGMQQRVSIARALAFEPKILLMDEPFGALDEMTRDRLNLELLNAWSATGTTIIFVTHSIPEAVFLSDRVVAMSPHPGRVESIIEVDLPRPRNPETQQDPRFFALVSEVRRHLREV